MTLNIRITQQYTKPIKDEANFKIYGFMRSEMDLKGTELLVYAMIYSYASSCTPFRLSRQRISEWLGCSLSSVDRALSSLIERHYIDKRDCFGKTVEYVIVVENLPDIPMHQGLLRICKEDEREQKNRICGA